MNNAATFQNRHAILVISVVISLRKTRTVEPWETCEWRRHRSRYWYVVLSLLKIRFDVFRLRSGRVVNNVHTALAPADFCFLAEIRWKVSRGMKRRWNEWFTFRFEAMPVGGRVIDDTIFRESSQRSLYLRHFSTLPYFSHDGTRFFQAFISITGCINIRGVFLDLMKRMKNAKSFQLAHSTNSFLSRDILVCVRSNLYIYIYRNIHSC